MKNIHQYIEQTNLNPLIKAGEIDQLIAEAKQYNFHGICLPPYWVKKAKRELQDTSIALVTVIGFPLGYQKSEVKLQEVQSAIKDGATELDVVVNLSAIKNEEYHWIKLEMSQLAQAVHDKEGILKVIMETCYLNQAEMANVCEVCVQAGVDFMKTSTGFAKEGAKVEDIRWLRSILPENVGIKASGGIRDYEKALTMIQAGADRIGTSSGVSILSGNIEAKKNTY
jgi:deoxyribose-phosphate aldolase